MPGISEMIVFPSFQFPWLKDTAANVQHKGLFLLPYGKWDTAMYSVPNLLDAKEFYLICPAFLIFCSLNIYYNFRKMPVLCSIWDQLHMSDSLKDLQLIGWRGCLFLLWTYIVLEITCPWVQLLNSGFLFSIWYVKWNKEIQKYQICTSIMKDIVSF